MNSIVFAATIVILNLLGSFLPSIAFATDGNGYLVSILDKSKQTAQNRMASLQNSGINETTGMHDKYSQALVEYNAALDSINNNTSVAKTHAFLAMELFKDVIEGSQQNTIASYNDSSVLLQNISDSEAFAKKLRVIAAVNGVSANFSDYDTKIRAASELVAKNDLSSANANLVTAQDLLDNLYSQMESQAMSSQHVRVTQFLKDTQNTLAKMIDNAKSLGMTQSTVDSLQAVLDKLHDAKTAEDIIDTTNQTGQLQDLTDRYNDQRIINFQKESARIQHNLDVLQGNAAQIHIQFSGLYQIIQLLDDIKQKAANGQTSEASQDLDQVDSLFENMNDVVNGAPELIQQINSAKSLALSLQNKSQGNQDLLDNIGQAIQMLDTSYSMIGNSTSESDLDSVKDSISQAKNMLNDINDSLIPSSDNNTQSQNPSDNNTQSQNPSDNNTQSQNPSDNNTQSQNPSDNNTSNSNSTQG